MHIDAMWALDAVLVGMWASSAADCLYAYLRLRRLRRR